MSPPVDDAEDDYMSMTIVEPTKPRGQKETYSELRKRKQRESEINGRTKSKKELEAEENERREAALSSSTLDPTNKGFKMMAKLGFTQGTALGKRREPDARREPVNLVMKEDRGGIGLDSEKKRKFREEMDGEAKRVKAEEGDYRERVRIEREEKRLEAQVLAAQKVAERLDTEEEVHEEDGEESTAPTATVVAARKRKAKPTSQINVLWRGLVRHREEKERERRVRYDFNQSLSRLPTYDDPDEDEEDKLALEKKDALEEEVEKDDEELDEFNALQSAEKLRRLVEYLREKYRYCFWCKYRYPDEGMEGCPGITEEDHD